jgi:hypothetical protein
MPKQPSKPQDEVQRGDRLRVIAYLSLPAWETFALIANNAGMSMSALAADILYGHMERAGYKVTRIEGRAKRSDFKPAKTLGAAYKAREATLARQMERVKAKSERLARQRRNES